MLKERLEENAGRRFSCQLVPNSLIMTSPVQVLEVSHDVFIDLAFERKLNILELIQAVLF